MAQPLSLSLAQLKQGYAARQQFITLECISNPVGGPLIGTTLWTGPSFRDVLAGARPLPGALGAPAGSGRLRRGRGPGHIETDPRILLLRLERPAAAAAHGYPLRVYVPDVYGMKQPKWIVQIVLVPDFIPGYWVTRGWDARAAPHHVGDRHRGDQRPHPPRGQTYVPVGGIADAGSRGISRVEVQVDGGPGGGRAAPRRCRALTWTSGATSGPGARASTCSACAPTTARACCR